MTDASKTLIHSYTHIGNGGIVVDLVKTGTTLAQLEISLSNHGITQKVEVPLFRSMSYAFDEIAARMRELDILDPAYLAPIHTGMEVVENGEKLELFFGPAGRACRADVYGTGDQSSEQLKQERQANDAFDHIAGAGVVSAESVGMVAQAIQATVDEKGDTPDEDNEAQYDAQEQMYPPHEPIIADEEDIDDELTSDQDTSVPLRMWATACGMGDVDLAQVLRDDKLLNNQIIDLLQERIQNAPHANVVENNKNLQESVDRPRTASCERRMYRVIIGDKTYEPTQEELNNLIEMFQNAQPNPGSVVELKLDDWQKFKVDPAMHLEGQARPETPSPALSERITALLSKHNLQLKWHEKGGYNIVGTVFNEKANIRVPLDTSSGSLENVVDEATRLVDVIQAARIINADSELDMLVKEFGIEILTFPNGMFGARATVMGPDEVSKGFYESAETQMEAAQRIAKRIRIFLEMSKNQ